MTKDEAEWEEVRIEKAGQRLAELLGLSKGKDGCYATTHGPKTDLGLARTAFAILTEEENN